MGAGVMEFQVQEILNRVFDPTNNRLNVLSRVGDDESQVFGGGAADAVIHYRNSTLGANTGITNVTIGTPASQAIAADTLMFSTRVANGDIAFYSNLGGNSIQWLFYDTSASTLYAYPNGVGGLSLTSILGTFESAASTSNQTFTVSNTSNAAAASHAIIEAKVGGTTSTGDPQFRWSTPGGTSFYAGVDNSDSDKFKIGTAAVVGTNTRLTIDPTASGASTVEGFKLTPFNVTLPDGANVVYRSVIIDATTTTLAGTTQVTALQAGFAIAVQTIAQSGGAVTAAKATGMSSISPTAGASVTLTHSSAYRALTGGAAVNVSGMFYEAQTGGTTGNYQILMVNGGTSPPSLADHVGLSAIDLEAGHATLAIATETAVVAAAPTASHYLRIRINGVNYRWCLDEDS